VSALQHFRAPHGLAPGPGYSHAVTGRGRWVATAGQVAIDSEGKLVGPGDPEAQTRQVFANLSRALDAAGASFADVIKLNYYVTDISMLPVVRAIRDEYVDTACVLQTASMEHRCCSSNSNGASMSFAAADPGAPAASAVTRRG
jgi:enamine deaminase RidA (YjgF/YER057c/UK114 family)